MFQKIIHDSQKWFTKWDSMNHKNDSQNETQWFTKWDSMIHKNDSQKLFKKLVKKIITKIFQKMIHKNISKIDVQKYFEKWLT